MNWRIFAVFLLFAFAATAKGADNAAPRRIPWTTSRIHGSPEPPKPFVAQRIQSQLQFKEALELVFEPLTQRWFALERTGKIFSWPGNAEVDHADFVVDMKKLHADAEQVFGLAFHPKFAENHQVFVTYTAGPPGTEDGTKLSRFLMNPGSAGIPAGSRNERPTTRATNAAGTGGIPSIDPSSEQLLLTWRSGGHNGANLQFGSDGMLYISTGDSEVPSPPDPLNTGQDISDLLSSILRIDVDHTDPGLAYAIPKDNPFIGVQVGSPALRPNENPNDSLKAELRTVKARAEVWAYGLRNPWKMSFDRPTGRLWCGDVGWELWEMIHLIERGGNYGWSAMEAGQAVRADAPPAPTPIRPPVVAHPHDEAASITGGYVYHGKKFPELEGAYIYGDWVTGKIWALWHDGKQVTRREEIAETHHKIITFGQDGDGELVYLDYSNTGALYELVRNKVAKTEKFPTKLSESGLFKSVRPFEPADGVYEFGINAPMWQDGEWISDAGFNSYFVALPGSSAVRTLDAPRNVKGKPQWPVDAVLAKNLLHEHDGGMRLIETQILHYDGIGWNAYSYRWGDDGRDATLVPSAGEERQLLPGEVGHPGKKRRYTWRFPSRAECIRCHNTWCDTALAFHPSQIRPNEPSGREQGHGLDELARLALIDSKFTKQSTARLVSPYSHLQPSEVRARSYLHANCSHCHRKNAGGAVTMMLNAELALDQTNAIGIAPLQGGLGLAKPKLIDPGNPWNSVIALRLAKAGSGHMPIIGPHEVDVDGLRLIEDWIARMGDKVADAVELLPKEWNESLLKEKLATVEGAMQVLRAVDDGLIKGPLRLFALETAWQSSQPTVRDLFDRFLPDDRRAATLGLSPDPKGLLAIRGDPARGSRMLSPQGKLATCFACHLINGAGREFGPDLSKVATRLQPEQILESLLMPSKVIAQGYQAVSVETKDGAVQGGFVVKEDADEIGVKTATGQTVTLQKSDISKLTSLPASLMPEGLMQSLTAQEVADVVSFLGTLK